MEIMFGTRAYIEITSTVPFFKSFKPISEVVSVKLQQAIIFEKGYSGCYSCAFSERWCHFWQLLCRTHALIPSWSKVRAHGKIDLQYQSYGKKSL
jgi:hypothetical protein